MTAVEGGSKAENTKHIGGVCVCVAFLGHVNILDAAEHIQGLSQERVHPSGINNSKIQKQIQGGFMSCSTGFCCMSWKHRRHDRCNGKACLRERL